MSSSNLFSEENVAGALFLTSPTVSSSENTGAPPRRDDDRRDDAFAPLPIRRLFFVFVWVDDDRKFVERFFSNFFQSIFFYRWVSACLFFGGGVLFIVVNTLCVCVHGVFLL